MDNKTMMEIAGECYFEHEREHWVTRSVYCNLCGHDWQAVYDEINTTRLECPNCHGMSRVNEVRQA